MFETDLHSWLTTRPAVASLVGSTAGSKIHADVAPQSSAPPRIVVQVISDLPHQDLDDTVGIRVARVQFRAVAIDKSTALGIWQALADALRTLNAGASSGGQWMAATFVIECRPDGVRDTFSPAADASGKGLHSRQADYLIHYQG